MESDGPACADSQVVKRTPIELGSTPIELAVGKRKTSHWEKKVPKCKRTVKMDGKLKCG